MSTSIKLSITVGAALAARYDRAALARIARAVDAWRAADAKRGIRTAHVALDDAKAMAALGVTPLSGHVSAASVKRKLDALCRRLRPDYVVLFGGRDIVPMFVVPNPSYDPHGDDDRDVPTDNPYACATPYRPTDRKSYLVPDRALGRITDLDGDADPAWLVDYLARVTAWKPQPRAFYDRIYAVVCHEWKAAGEACMTYLGLSAAQLQVSPPAHDADAAAKARLPHTLHLVKCHGASLDPRFYGQKGTTYPEVLTSPTLRGRLSPGTLAAAMCCYGAQVYSPADPAAQLPGAWPLATTYLRQGAVGFAGSTRIAWVGIDAMMCADWIAAAFLKSALGGASLGRSLLESRQDYVRWLAGQGQAPDSADEKTLIEFVLLGDPSLHPVATAATPARKVSPLVAQERGQRRAVRAVMAAQIRKDLPHREPARPADARAAQRLFGTVAA
ncbi:MAG TPA: C25 family cysteine peptidase, partial [Ideonella sp.]|nr:C25 family cysteine peptidase [Ideonella sp.]